MPTISVIIPTIGRPTLSKVFTTILPQLGFGDEVIVIGDGPTPAAREIVRKAACPIIKYLEHGPIWNYGNPQRNLGMERATRRFLMFIDDDDDPIPDGIATVRTLIARSPDRPHIFRISVPWGFIPKTRKVSFANVSGQGFIPPNVKGRLGKWSGRYEGDYDFISGTVAFYGPDAVVWHEEVICHVVPAGRGKIGHDIK